MPEATQMCLLQHLLKEKLFRQNQEASHKQKRHSKLWWRLIFREMHFSRIVKGWVKLPVGDRAVCKVAASQSRCLVGER